MSIALCFIIRPVVVARKLLEQTEQKRVGGLFALRLDEHAHQVKIEGAGVFQSSLQLRGLRQADERPGFVNQRLLGVGRYSAVVPERKARRVKVIASDQDSLDIEESASRSMLPSR